MKEETVQPRKIGSIRRSWLITKSTWKIVKLDKEIVVVPLVSGFIGLIVAIVGFGGGFLLSNSWHNYYNNIRNSVASPQNSGPTFHFNHTTDAVWIVTAALLALLSTYTLAAMISIGLKRLRGEDPTISDGYRAVKKNFRSLTIFSLFSFGIVQILQYLQNRLPFAGKLLAFLGQLAWGIAAFFAVPVIVDGGKPIGPINATKESISLIKRTWKESGVNQFTLGAIFGVIMILELLIGVGGTVALAVTAGAGLGIVAGSLTVLAIVLTSLVSSAMEGIAKAVLYYYAVTGEAPEQFDKRLLHEAFTPKKARRVFAH